MAANTVTKDRAYSGSQAGAFVDVVTFNCTGDTLLIDNRSTTVNIWLTWCSPGNTPTTPSASGDNCFFVPAGAFRSWRVGMVGVVKLIGDANNMLYTVAVV